MSVSASEIDRTESGAGSKAGRRHAEGFRVEAVQYYLKARGIDPEKTIEGCAAELGMNEKTLDDRAIRHGGAGGVTRERSDGQRALDEANRRIRELELEDESPKRAAAFFVRGQARATGAGRCRGRGRATTRP